MNPVFVDRLSEGPIRTIQAHRLGLDGLRPSWRIASGEIRMGMRMSAQIAPQRISIASRPAVDAVT